MRFHSGHDTPQSSLFSSQRYLEFTIAKSWQRDILVALEYVA